MDQADLTVHLEASDGSGRVQVADEWGGGDRDAGWGGDEGRGGMRDGAGFCSGGGIRVRMCEREREWEPK